MVQGARIVRHAIDASDFTIKSLDLIRLNNFDFRIAFSSQFTKLSFELKSHPVSYAIIHHYITVQQIKS